jgi:hypothetical protein
MEAFKNKNPNIKGTGLDDTALCDCGKGICVRDFQKHISTDQFGYK